jgi:hypothetical protein
VNALSDLIEPHILSLSILCSMNFLKSVIPSPCVVLSVEAVLFVVLVLPRLSFLLVNEDDLPESIQGDEG